MIGSLFLFYYCFKGCLDVNNGLGKELLEFSIIEEGGKFVAQESLKKHLSSVIKCVANFVDFGDGSNRYTTFDSDVYKVLQKNTTKNVCSHCKHFMYRFWIQVVNEMCTACGGFKI